MSNNRDTVPVFHRDSRNMFLTEKDEWPKDGLLIRSHATPANLKVLWRPAGDPTKPWIVQTYLEWGPDWFITWSCRLSAKKLLTAFGPLGQGEVVEWGCFVRGRTVVTFPATHVLEVRNGDPFCQIALKIDMVKAVQELVEQHDPKSIQATA